MRTATLTAIVFVAMSYATTAQKLTLLPQAGIENSRTTVQYNGLSSFLPAGEVLSPYLGVRIDYTFKQGHGLFAGIATSHSVVSYNFSDLETGMKVYNASPGDMKLRFEGGYQFSTKRIYFNKSGSASNSAKSQPQTSTVRKGCGGSLKYYCGRSSDKAMNHTKTKNKGWYMSVQPSLGLALSPSSESVISSAEGTQTNYSYKAGNWSTAVTAGTGIEFGKNKQRMFTIGINYLKGIGNLDTRTITATVGNKITTATLKSAVSSWNITAGIPITLTKSKTAFKQKAAAEKSNQFHWKCGQYRSGCNRMIKQ
ncbi:MAG TPA: hypothetical protein VH396_11600 [Chitinophagaceae bacterium]